MENEGVEGVGNTESVDHRPVEEPSTKKAKYGNQGTFVSDNRHFCQFVLLTSNAGPSGVTTPKDSTSQAETKRKLTNAANVQHNDEDEDPSLYGGSSSGVTGGALAAPSPLYPRHFPPFLSRNRMEMYALA